MKVYSVQMPHEDGQSSILGSRVTLPAPPWMQDAEEFSPGAKKRLALSGMTDVELAQKLGVSETTAYYYRRRIQKNGRDGS